MKRAIGSLVVSVLVMLALFTVAVMVRPRPVWADPAEYVGQFCWKLNPYVDVIRVPIQWHPEEAVPIFEIHGLIKAEAEAGQNAVGGPGPVTYQLLGAGTVAYGLAPNAYDVGFQATHNKSTHFGGNRGCNFYASLNAFLGGSWHMECPGTTTYVKSGTVTLIGCPED